MKKNINLRNNTKSNYTEILEAEQKSNIQEIMISWKKLVKVRMEINILLNYI